MRSVIAVAGLLGLMVLPTLGSAAGGDALYASLRGQGKLPVVGFAWEGAPQPVTVDRVATRPSGDLSVALQLQGGKKACRRLDQVRTEGKPLPRLRLRDQGKQVGVVLRNATVTSVDCNANPWTVELAAEQVKVRRRE